MNNPVAFNRVTMLRKHDIDLVSKIPKGNPYSFSIYFLFPHTPSPWEHLSAFCLSGFAYSKTFI